MYRYDSTYNPLEKKRTLLLKIIEAIISEKFDSTVTCHKNRQRNIIH